MTAPQRSAATLRTGWVLVFLAVLAAALIFAFDPAAHSFFPSCPLYSATGLACPLCGGLRAAHLLMRGQVRAAFALNPFLFVSVPALALLFLRPLRRHPAPPWIVLAVLAAYVLWRNFK